MDFYYCSPTAEEMISPNSEKPCLKEDLPPSEGGRGEEAKSKNKMESCIDPSSVSKIYQESFNNHPLRRGSCRGRSLILKKPICP